MKVRELLQLLERSENKEEEIIPEKKNGKINIYFDRHSKCGQCDGEGWEEIFVAEDITEKVKCDECEGYGIVLLEGEDSKICLGNDEG